MNKYRVLRVCVFVCVIIPGTDDNGSGCAALLEAARVISSLKAKAEYTIKFVALDMEEWTGPVCILFGRKAILSSKLSIQRIGVGEI